LAGTPIANHRDPVTTSHLPGGKPESTSSDDHRHKEIGMSELAGTADVIVTVDGGDSYVRIQVLTNAGALDRGKQLTVVDRLTTIAADGAGDRRLRTNSASFSRPESMWLMEEP
jgi:hypothetical protein